MAYPTAWHGHKTSVAIGGTCTIDDGELLSLEWSGISRESIETTYIAVGAATPGTNFGNQTRIPAGTSDPGEISMEFNFDPDQTEPPTDFASTTIVVTWADGGTVEDTANWAANGFCTAFSLSCATDEKMTCSCTYKLTGAVTMTDDV